jgi:alginate O-acetyltransferase complex protein AlgI
MVFSSPIFLFVFLPAVLACCLFRTLPARNLWLLLFSIIFYAWGEVVFVFLMLGSTLLNYLLGWWVDRESAPNRRRWAVAVAVILNVGLLAFFKYAGFAVANLNAIFNALGLAPVHVAKIRMPIGISFFTFHALSYVIDVYRKKWAPARNPLDLALYIFFFPQLIAGPILRWNAMAPQFASRIFSRLQFAEGVRRFICGLAKKTLIANTVAVPADAIFKVTGNGGALTPALAWLGAVSYALQIYFDFSGYSDMAVGLGKMFGFEFMENFNHPYISTSIREFWRRWHISLSTWFRDYLYIPLGGNRCSETRNRFNLLVVFFLCGLWHGPSWTFAVWGLYHGGFLALERTRFGAALEQMPPVFRRVYVLPVVLAGWVIFRASTIPEAMGLLGNMVGLGAASSTVMPLASQLTHQVAVALVAGLIFSTPCRAWLKARAAGVMAGAPEPARQIAGAANALVEFCALTGLFVVSVTWLAGGTYNPFIYYRF